MEVSHGPKPSAIPTRYESGDVLATLRQRGTVPRGAHLYALAIGLRVPGVRGALSQLLQAATPVPMLGMQPPSLGQSGDDLSSRQGPADEMVPGDLPAGPVEKRHLSHGADAPARRQVRHRLADEAEDHGGDVRGQCGAKTRRRCAGR